jgi:hypothetical protein
VAVDDAFGLIVFSLVLVMVIAGAETGLEGDPRRSRCGRDLGGALLVGLLTGLPAALSHRSPVPGRAAADRGARRRLPDGGSGGLARRLAAVAGIVAGTVVANFARHHERAFHEIEHVEWPFMLMFFLLAGASLEVERLPELGRSGWATSSCASLARIIGGWLGGTLAGLPRAERHWIGPALLPQAGVAVGMALVAGEAFPQWHDTILTLTVGHDGRSSN